MDKKDFTILLQNLMNRAVEIELHNARLESRIVDIKNVEAALDGVMGIARSKLAAFLKKLGN